MARLGIVVAGLALVVGVAVGGTACGAGGEEVSPQEAAATAVSSTPTQSEWVPGSGEAVNPCSLITKSEAEEALGESVMQPSRYDWLGLDRCDYRFASGADVRIQIGELPSKDEFESIVQGDVEAYGGTAEALDGLGDEAFVIEERPTSSTVEILRGHRWLVVSVGLPSDLRITDSEESARAKAEALAAKAVERLP